MAKAQVDVLDPISRRVEEAFDAILAEVPELEELVDVVALALDQLTGPVMRGAATGRRSVVTVEDERVAAVFRKALERTSDHRPTDALVDVIVTDREARRV